MPTRKGETPLGRADSERLRCDAAVCRQGGRNTTTIPPQVDAWLDEASAQPSFGVWAIVLAFVVALAILTVSLAGALGRAALVGLVADLEGGQPPTLHRGWEHGLRHALQVWAISILLALPSLVLFLAGVVPVVEPMLRAVRMENESFMSALSDQAAGRLVFCFLPACAAGLIIGTFARLVRTIAIRAYVLRGRSVWSSIVGAWRLLNAKLRDVVGLWGAIIAVRIAIGILLSMPCCMTGSLAEIPVAVLGSAGSSVVTSVVYGFTLLVWIGGTAGNAVIETLVSTCWTLKYRELTVAEGHVGGPSLREEQWTR